MMMVIIDDDMAEWPCVFGNDFDGYEMVYDDGYMTWYGRMVCDHIKGIFANYKEALVVII